VEGGAALMTDDDLVRYDVADGVATVTPAGFGESLRDS